MVDGKVQATYDARFGSTINDPTREGLFHVYLGSRATTSRSSTASMPFAMFFSGGQAVHYPPDFASDGYYGASHGCVNMRDYKGDGWLFDQVRVGDGSSSTGPDLPQRVAHRVGPWRGGAAGRQRPRRFRDGLREPVLVDRTVALDLPAGLGRRPARLLPSTTRSPGCAVARAWSAGASPPRSAPAARPASPTPTSGGPRRPAAPRCATRSASPAPDWSCFGTFAFADEPGESVLVVPEVVVGRRGERHLADHHRPRVADRRSSTRRPPAAAGRRGLRRRRPRRRALDGRRRRGGRRINAGGLEKVVLARDLMATAADAPIDVRWPLQRLAEDYPMCWTFHVDGLFGATPELLVRRERGLVTSRVLAGTIRRTGDDGVDLALAATLARSSKDLEEHEYAVRSVAEALEPHCSSMNVPEAPFVLHLPNVMHLATDVAGVVHDAATVSSLELAAALHPRGRRRHADHGGHRPDRRARGDGPGPVRRPGRLDGRHRRRRVGLALRSAGGATAHRPAVRRLRHRGRLRPRGRAGRGPGQVRPVRDALVGR